MTTLTATHRKLSAPTSATISWKVMVRRIFERLGEQHAHSPNML
jgi:hypothetical protein